MKALLDAVLLDVGGTLIEEAPPGTPAEQLVARLLPGVLDDLRSLASAGVRLGAVTNTAMFTEADVRGYLAPSGVDELLEVVVTSIDVGARKPDPLALVTALERLGLDDPARVLYVGDLPTDHEAAVAAGMNFAPVNGDGIAAAVERWLADAAGRRFAGAVDRIIPVDAVAAGAAAEHHDRLTKPRGALGRLEAAGIQLAAIARTSPPPVPEPATVAVFAGDHGVLAEGVTPWPQEVTAQMVANFAAGGAAINVLARHAGADVIVVDVGVAAPVPGVLDRNVRRGTGNIAVEAALSRTEALMALDAGAEVAERAVAAGARCLVTGDMGIGNTTPSAAVIAALTGRSPVEVTGRGTGVDDATLAAKVTVVERAIARSNGLDGVDLLAEVGGAEILAIAGFIVGGAAAGVPVIVDGVIAAAGLLAAVELAPDVVGYAVAGHRSTEPGSAAVLEHLGLAPLLDLDLRLGEGSGATLALPVLQAAAKILREMATFDAAGVTEKS